MKISARVQNSEGQHRVTLRTNENVHAIAIPPKPTGFGSSANGGELLFLAIATTFTRRPPKEGSKWSVLKLKWKVTLARKAHRP